MSEKPPLTPAEHIARAKDQLANPYPGAAHYATAHALVAIAELMAQPAPGITIDHRFAAPPLVHADQISDAADDAEHTEPTPDPDFECQSCGKRTTVDTPTGWRCTECGSSDDHTEPDAVSVTAEGVAVIESGLSLRHAHELKTGCTAGHPCAQCRRTFGDGL